MRNEKRERETEGVRREGRRKGEMEGGQEGEERKERGERLFTKKSTIHCIEMYMYK